jgi:membrane-associated protein
MTAAFPLLDPTSLLTGAGPWVALVVAAIVFVETGLLFPFLPGDSLIFTAALLSVPLHLPLWVLIPVVVVAAVAGDATGYEIGRRWGRSRFRPDARVLRTQYLDQADAFLARYGGRAIVLARFVPIVRTFVPPIVGMSSMPYRRFLRWNVLGALGWAVVASLAGYWFGHIAFVAAHVDLIAIVLVLLSVIPIGVDLLKTRRAKARSATPGPDDADDVQGDVFDADVAARDSQPSR